MNKLIIILLLIFITSLLAFAENIPEVPDISGPSIVHVNATNVIYRLVNYNQPFDYVIL